MLLKKIVTGGNHPVLLTVRKLLKAMRPFIFPGILLLRLVFFAGQAQANSYAFELLEKVPTAEEVFAFE